MKKVLSLILIFLLLFMAFGCSVPDEESSATADVIDKTEQQTVIDKPVKKQHETKEPEPETEEETYIEPSTLYVPEEFTIDDEFSPYEVVVTLTAEESVQNNIYTTESFKQVDAFYVYRFDSYYEQSLFPQLFKNTTIFLMINEPSKERVLKYCEILEKDDRVLFATPNPYDYAVYEGEYCAFEVTFSDVVSATFPISKADFANVGEFLMGAGNMTFTDDFKHISIFDQVVFKFKGTGYDFIKEKLLLIAQNPKVLQARPMITKSNSTEIRIELTEERMFNTKELVASEFPGVDVKKIISNYHEGEERYSPEVTIVLKEFGHKKAGDSLRKLEKNPIVKELEPSYELSNDTYKSPYSTNTASYYSGYLFK